MKHKWHSCADPECTVCTGGLSLCAVCGGAEGWLTTDCPGHRVPYETGEQVGKGRMDFVEGQGWVRLSKNLQQTNIDAATVISTAYIPRDVATFPVDTYETVIFHDDKIAWMQFFNREEAATTAHKAIINALQGGHCAVCRQALNLNNLGDRLDAMLRPWCKPCVESFESRDPDGD